MKATNWWPMLYACVLVLLMGQNFLLVRKNNEYVRYIERLNAQTSEREMLQPGDTLSAIDTFGLDGYSIIFDPTLWKKRGVIIAFTAHCPACQENAEKWHLLHERLNSYSVEMSALTPDSLHIAEEFRQKHGLKFPVYSYQGNAEVAAKYRLTRFPQTFIVENGSVLAMFAGSLSEERRKRIEELALGHE